MSQIKIFQRQVEHEIYETSTTAVAREAIQCTDTTDIMNHEDFIYANCDEEKSYREEKSELVPPPIAVDIVLYNQNQWTMIEYE